MKIYSKKAFIDAQSSAKAAVEIGSKNGAQFDWHCAMILLAVAYGRHEMNENDFKWSYYYGEDNAG